MDPDVEDESALTSLCVSIFQLGKWDNNKDLPS